MRAQACGDDVEAVTYEEAQTGTARMGEEIGVRRERKSMYIGKLVEATRRRKEEIERVKERQLVREMEEEGGERFLTRGYRKELKKREEEERGEREREREEERGGGREGREIASKAIFGGNEGGFRGEERKDVEGGKEGVRVVDAEGRGGERKRRRSRFDVVGSLDTSRTGVASAGERKGGSKGAKRGVRRNDERAIEEYRRRYFERMERRLKEGSLLWGKG